MSLTRKLTVAEPPSMPKDQQCVPKLKRHL